MALQCFALLGRKLPWPGCLLLLGRAHSLEPPVLPASRQRPMAVQVKVSAFSGKVWPVSVIRRELKQQQQLQQQQQQRSVFPYTL